MRFSPRALLAVVVCVILPVSLSSCVVVPKPIDTAANRTLLEAGLHEAYGRQGKIDKAVSLEEAMARAIRYNLDSRVKLMQEALVQGELGVARWDMLPKLAANAGYSHRSNYAASNSVNLDTGIESLSMSTSQDRDIRTADLSVAWNVLDFGVSYFHAKQQADRKLIMRERRRKAVHNLMQEVRLAYWQAAGSENLRARAAQVRQSAEKELAMIRKQRRNRLTSPIENLRQEKALLETMRQMQAIIDELAVAKPRLASLMGLPPGLSFRLEARALPEEGLAAIEVPVEEMERVALEHRPELRETAYEERISAQEARKAIARLLPGFELSGSKEYSSNSFAKYPNWWEGGMSVTWNLMNIPSAPQRIKTAEAGRKVAKAKGVAMAMAVLSQVYVSRSQQGGAIRQYLLARQQWEVEQQLLWYVEAGHKLDVLSKREYIQSKANAVKSELALYMAHAAMESAQGTLYASLGLDPFVDIDETLPVDQLADTIARALAAWQEGRFGWVKEEVARIKQSALLFSQGQELYREERYAAADSVFAGLLAIDPFNEAARNYREIMIPVRVARIETAEELSRRARKAVELQQEGKPEEARELWKSIITESKQELQK